jgi:hypothetical protein
VVVQLKQAQDDCGIGFGRERAGMMREVVS